jgi:hypothetical protein
MEAQETESKEVFAYELEGETQLRLLDLWRNLPRSERLPAWKSGQPEESNRKAIGP